jgi:hypothetical protein
VVGEWDTSADERPQRGRRVLAWGSLLGLAWLICEITAYPLTGPLFAGVKLAWEDFRTAFWLRAVDPEPRRGRIGCRIYLSWGLTKLFLSTFAFCPLVELLHLVIGGWLPAQGRNFAWDLQLLIGAWITMLATLVVLPLVALPAFWSARRLGQKVWVNSDVGESRRRGAWPPRGGTANHFPFLELVILLALSFGPVCALVLFLMATGHHPITEAVFPFAVILLLCWTFLMIACCYSESPLQKKVMRALVPESAVSAEEFWGSESGAMRDRHGNK